MITKCNLQRTFALDAESCVRADLPTQIWLTEDIRDFSAFWPRTTSLGTARCWAFQCADIVEVWCDTIGIARQTQAVFAAVVNADGQPLALLPLGIERRQGIRILQFLDGGVSDYNAPVLFPAVRSWDARKIRAVWRGLVKALPPFDLAILEKVPDYVGDLPNPLTHLTTSILPTSGHAISLCGTWTDFLKNRLPNARDSRRSYRRLSEKGTPKFEIASTPEQCNLFLDAMIRQKSQRYIETFGKDGFAEPGKRAYYVEMTRRLSMGGPIHISALRLDEAIIATHWGFVAGSHFYYMMPSYEGGDWRRFSPGRLLNEYLIEWSFQNGINVFDFGIGDEDYKTDYCDVVVRLSQAVIPRTLRGWVWTRVREAKHFLASTKVWALLKSQLAKRGLA